MIKIAILVGSKSDLEIMQAGFKILKDFEIQFEVKILSAHRAHDLLAEYMKEAHEKGVKIFIAGAGFAAHLAGVIASKTVCPVIGIPINSSPLNGLDSLLSTVQMPGGIPVATVTIGKAGAKNAALLAIQMLSLADESLVSKLKKYRQDMVEDIKEQNKDLKV